MSREDHSPSSELIDALRGVSADADAYGTMQERVSKRLARSMALAGPLTDGAEPPHPITDLAPRAATLAGKGIAIGWLVPVFAAGVLAGISADRVHTAVTAQRAVTGSPSAIATQHTPPATPVEALAPTVQPTPAIPAAAPSAEARPAAMHAAPADTNAGLAAEQRILDTARTTLARGEQAAALGPLELHAQRFPNGKLAEEREALGVRVLALLGRDAEATARADGFHRRFPGSLFAPVVDNALDAISRRKSEGVPNQER